MGIQGLMVLEGGENWRRIREQMQWKIIEKREGKVPGKPWMGKNVKVVGIYRGNGEWNGMEWNILMI